MRYTTPLKAASVSFSAQGIYRGVIVSVEGNRVDLRVPRLSGELVYRDLEVIGNQGVSVGDLVAVGFVEGLQDELIVLGRIRDYVTAPTTGGDPGDDTVIDEIDVSLARSLKYIVQAAHDGDYTVSEILVVHNDSTASFTEYAYIATAGLTSRLADYDVSINGAVIQLIATPAVSGVVFTVNRVILEDA